MAIKSYVSDRFVGLSTDTKPTDVPDGAWFVESDTLIEYLRVGGAWVAMGNYRIPTHTPPGGISLVYPAEIIPQYTFTEGTGYKTLVSTFENGVEQRRQKWSRSKKQFTLLYNVLTRTELGTLSIFFDVAQGQYETFVFTNPVDSVVYSCRFADDSFSYEQFEGDLVKLSVRLVEVF